MSDEIDGLDELASSAQPGQAATPPPAGLDQFVESEKYGSGAQSALAAGEAGVQGLLGPVGTGLLKLAGAKNEEIRARAEANPNIHTGFELGGFGAGLLTGTGEAGLLNKAGEALQAGMGVTKAAPLMTRVGAGAIRGAFENALYAGGDEVSKMFLNDPHQSAETAAIDIGLSAILGGGLGGLLGAGKGMFPEEKAFSPTSMVSELDRAAVEGGDFKAGIESTPSLSAEEKQSIFDGLGRQKPNSKEIRSALQDIGAEPLEGILSDNKAIQMGEDALLNGAPSYSGLKRQQLYNDVYKKAFGAVDASLGAESGFSKAQLGQSFKQSLSEPIEKQAELLGAGYDEIKKYYEAIPLSEKSAPAIARNIAELTELRLSPSSPEGKLASRVIDEIGNLKTVDDVKTYKSILNRSIAPTASSGEKRMVAILNDKLSNLEENSIRRAAESMQTGMAKEKILGLLDQREALNKQYKPFIEKVQTLLEKLGKKKVYGPQDAINFIQENLTPESVVDRLFSKNDSEFLKFFSDNFPNEMKMMSDYQKSVIREASSKAGELNLKNLFTKINNLEPEIAQKIFSPDQLRRISSAETVIKSFPKAFNPSGTSHMSAFRSFFEHPTGAVVANIRDFGIEKFIKMVGSDPEMNVAGRLAQATINGEKAANSAIKNLFNPTATIIPVKAIASDKNIEKLKDLVDQYNANPGQALDGGIKNNPIPEYNTAFGTMTASSIQYLNSIRPKTGRPSPLDSEIVPTKAQNMDYNRALSIAEKPLSILNYIKNGTIGLKDIQTLQAIHPNLYRRLRDKMGAEMINHTSKDKAIPYKSRISMSIFMGEPLDSTMSGASILAAQPKPQQPQQQPMQVPRHRPNKSLNPLPGLYATPSQARQEDRSEQT